MDFRILGPLEVEDDGTAVDLKARDHAGGVEARELLAAVVFS